MLQIPLFSVLLYYLLLKNVVGGSKFELSRLYPYLFLIFITGVYLFGASSGTHEVTNYLNLRFCEAGKIDSKICNIISYNDDEFSHIVYYLGFILLNVALMITSFNVPREKAINKKDLLLVSINAVFIGLGIFANLAFEEIGLDLYFFGSMMLLSLYLLLRKKIYLRLPVLVYLATSYTFV